MSETSEFCGPHRLTRGVQALNDALGDKFTMPMPARTVDEQRCIGVLKNRMIDHLELEFPHYEVPGGNVAVLPTDWMMRRAALELRWDLLTVIEQEEGEF